MSTAVHRYHVFEQVWLQEEFVATLRDVARRIIKHVTCARGPPRGAYPYYVIPLHVSLLHGVPVLHYLVECEDRYQMFGMWSDSKLRSTSRFLMQWNQAVQYYRDWVCHAYLTSRPPTVDAERVRRVYEVTSSQLLSDAHTTGGKIMRSKTQTKSDVTGSHCTV